MKFLVLLLLLLSPLTHSLAGDDLLAQENIFLDQCTSPNEYQAGLEIAKNPAGLRVGQRVAILLYTGYMFSSINGKLWREEPLDYCEALFVRVLDGALTALPDYQGVVYRGTTKKYLPLEAGKSYPSDLLGYTSTSTDPSVIENFLIDRREVLTVTTGKDISAYSGAYSGGVDEKEVLLPRGTQLFVTALSETLETLFVFNEETGIPGDEQRMVQTVHARQL